MKKSYKSNLEEIEKNLFVNYNARCNEYKNIKCTKYVFTYKYSVFAAYKFAEKIQKKQIYCFKTFCNKKQYTGKVKTKSDYQDNITNDYNIIDRVRVRVKNTDRILTMPLINYLYDYDGDLEVLEYILYTVQKKKEQGGCDTREHFECISSNIMRLQAPS